MSKFIIGQVLVNKKYHQNKILAYQVIEDDYLQPLLGLRGVSAFVLHTPFHYTPREFKLYDNKINTLHIIQKCAVLYLLLKLNNRFSQSLENILTDKTHQISKFEIDHFNSVYQSIKLSSLHYKSLQ